MKQINDTTFISDNLGDLKPVVTIGGKPVDKFIPNLNMSFHDDEFFINLNRRDKQAISATDKAEIDGIDKDIFYIDENGRFKWDIEFKERPSKNSWTWELKHTDGIEFYYQGELADEEIKDGCERPIEVVGSYAVYCNKVNNKYKTGKLCHIYRPFCYDINAESIYADLLIADGQLTITIDDKWLDNATYPVRLDPTIGYTSVGASGAAISYLRISFANAEAASTGTASKLYFYGRTSLSSKDIILGYYNYNSGGAGTVGDTATVTLSSTAAWVNGSVEGNIASGNNYYPACQVYSGGNVYVYFDSSSVNYMLFLSNYQTTIPDNPSPNTPDSKYYLSMYLEYTESSGGSSLPSIINNHRQQGVM